MVAKRAAFTLIELIFKLASPLLLSMNVLLSVSLIETVLNVIIDGLIKSFAPFPAFGLEQAVKKTIDKKLKKNKNFIRPPKSTTYYKV